MGDLRYIDAGVDIDAGNRAVNLIKQAVRSTHTPGVLGGIGQFAGAFALPPGFKEPVLVFKCIEGVSVEHEGQRTTRDEGANRPHGFRVPA